MPVATMDDLLPSLLPRQDNSTSSSDDAWSDFKLWHYTPSIAAAVIFAILFSALTSYHMYLLIKRRTWFCIPFLVGGALEVIGYVARAAAHSNTDSVTIYTIQSLCLLLAPILFAASVYMILGRIIRVVHGEAYTVIRVNWLTKIFVGGDIFCFMVQGAGGGLLSRADDQSSVNLGNNVILGGLILQIMVFVVFLLTALLFQTRINKQPTTAALDGPLGERAPSRGGRFGTLTWKKLMLGLYVTSVLITIRNLFRVIEYGMGWTSYLLVHEWPLYVFDGILMVLVLVVCIMWYNPQISKNKASTQGQEAHRMESGENVLSRGAQVTKLESNRQHPWS